MEAVNTSFAIFNKSGSKISQTDFKVFFGSLANNVNLSDPKVIYDQYSQRFVMLLLGYNTSKSVYLIAVSQTSDPSGSWYKYSSDASLDGNNSTTNSADYPGLGYDNNAIYVTSNQYANYLSGDFQYAKIRIFNKSQLYSGQSLTYSDFVNMYDNYGAVFTIKPAHHFGTISSAYLINTEPFGASSVTLWRIDNPINSPTLTKQATISIASYNSNSPYNTVKQKGTTILIDGGDSRTQDVMYRNGFLYTAFTTLHDWGSGPVEAIRYEKIDVNSNTAIIDALYGADNYYYFYPNIYVDAYGDIVLVYSRSNTNEYAGVYWSYRTPTDALAGSSQALKAGAGEYTVTWAMRNGNMRWGDYNGISLDASSDNQIWFTGEWATNNNSWNTQIGSFRFSPVLFANQNKNNLDLGGNLLVNSLLQISSQTKIGFKPNTNNSVKTLASGSVNSPLDRFGSQKHNNWNQTSSSYLLTNNFSAIDAPGQEQDARFDNLNAVTITASSLEVTSLSNINIMFNDPWYMNQNGSQGNNFAQATIPLTQTSSPMTGAYNQSSGGVFLGQNAQFNPDLPVYSVKAISPQTISINGRNHKFYFQNWEASPSGSADFQHPDQLETPVVFNNADATVNAVMKGTQLSNNINAYKNSSQRKIVRTANGDLYMVYESLGKVWLETSTDNGSTWSLMNGGESLSGNKEAKNPSIDQRSDTYEVVVVYQEKDGDHYNIVLKFIDGYDNNTVIVKDEQADSYSTNADPVIAWYPNGQAVVVWKRISPNPFYGSSGLYYWYGFVNGRGITPYSTGIVPNTNDKSKNPSIASIKKNDNLKFHLAWEQGPSYEKIKYYKITPNSNNTLSFSDYTEVSYPTGYGICKAPVIVVKNDNNPMVVYKLYSSSSGPANYVVRREKYSYGWSSVEMISISNRYIESASLGYADNGTYVTFFTDDLSNVWYKRSYWSSGPFQVSGLTAQAVQTSNWDDMGNMKAMSFNHASSPYEFKLTPAAVPQKATNTITNSQQIEGIVNSKDVYFDYNFGNILLDSQPVNFVKLDTDLKDKKNKDTENDLMTEPFVIDKSSELLVNASYFVNDKEKASELLDKNGFVEYEMELVDAVNPDKVISKLAGVKFNKDNLPELTQKYYSFNTEGLDNMQVRIKLNIKTNIKTETYNAKVYSANSEESNKKSNYETVNIIPKEIVKEYALNQNYPNPFNPTTTISYAIPKSGKVTLKVYDVLGKEVAVLVNGFKSKGRYSVRFNGNNLSSGIYFYKITSGDFNAAKKLLLLK